MNLDLLLGSAIRKIPSQKKTLFLTFDDGPAINQTEKVLQVLERHQAKATFFVIAEKAKQNKNLIGEIQSCSHTIGNHSLDHRYSNFFRGKKALLNWIQQSEDMIAQQIGTPTVGFRPPAGVRTPELGGALETLHIPLVLWGIRFFDTTFPWSIDRALRSLERTQNGAIILLHDHQKSERMDLFLNTLHCYIQAAKQEGFVFEALSRELCSESLK